MKAFKLLAVLLFTVLLAVSASAQINWMKNDGEGTNYLTWYVPKGSSETSYIYDNGKTRYIPFGGDASFATGYFGSTAQPPQIVKLTVTLNSVSTGKIVSTLFSGNVDVSETQAYKTFTITSKDYKNKAGQYIVVIKIQDANDQKVPSVDETLFLQVFPEVTIAKIPPGVGLIPDIPIKKDTEPEMKTKSFSKDILETDKVQFTVSATDKENDKLKYSIEECTASFGGICYNWASAKEFDLTFNENTGAFTWTPGYEYVQHTVPSLTRKAEFRFQAVETKNKDKDTQWVSVIINVHDVNRNPIIDPIGPKNIVQGEGVAFTVNAVDADKDVLQYSIYITNLPSQSYTFDTQSHQFKFIPGFTQDGVYTTVFQVDDDFGGQDFETSYIVITSAPENKVQCNDNEDNDLDGFKDAQDPGCHTDGNAGNSGTYNPHDDNETDEPVEETQCNDNEDNDGDQLKDEDDPGCHTDGDVKNGHSYNPKDDDESDQPTNQPQCNDNKDNDLDGFKDTKDPGCHTDGNAGNSDSYNPNDNDEKDEPVNNQPQCNDKKDNDRDELVDMNDPGCTNPNDNDESDIPSIRTQCNDKMDNDGDGLIDYGNDPRVNDPGCLNEEDNNEINVEYPENPSKPASFTNVKFKSVDVEDITYAGDLMAVNVNIFNNGKTNLKDVEIQATIFEVGSFGSTSDFSLPKNKGASKTILVHIPAEVQPGWYLIKITAKNYHYHTSTYRLAYIDSNTSK